MKISDISPVLYSAYPFKYVRCERKYPKLSLPKTQYVYRLMYVARGRVKVSLSDEENICSVGDLVYLTPGTVYRLDGAGCDFSLYSIFFSPVTAEPRGDVTSCVFLSDYDGDLCLREPDFEDAVCLNRSRVFRGADCAANLERLMMLERTEPYYEFHARSLLMSVISQILTAESKPCDRSPKVAQMLSYIRHNPDKDLSADALSEMFAYHKNYINQLIKGRTGKTLAQLVRNAKIEYAKALISEGTMSLTEVALTLGYYDYSHFYKAFAAEEGISPSEYLSLRKPIKERIHENAY